MADRAQSIVTIPITLTGMGLTNLVNVPDGYELVIVNLTLSVTGDETLQFEGTAVILGPFYLAHGVTLVLPDSKGGWARTAAGCNLGIRNQNGVGVGGSISYRLVPEHFEF